MHNNNNNNALGNYTTNYKYELQLQIENKT